MLVFLGGARSSSAGTGGGAWLALRAKMGSSVGVKTHQIAIFRGNGARKRSFFFGCAERKPDVFLGGKRFRVAGRDYFFLFFMSAEPTRYAPC